MIEIITGSGELLDVLRPLRESLLKHHAQLSEHFASDFASDTIDSTQDELLECSRSGRLYVALARAKDSKRHMGYCTTRILADRMGEIFSIFVDERYRGQGVGQKLMLDALDYLNQKDVNTISTHVLSGNDKVISFYKKFGFYPRTIVLKKENAIGIGTPIAERPSHTTGRTGHVSGGPAGQNRH